MNHSTPPPTNSKDLLVIEEDWSIYVDDNNTTQQQQQQQALCTTISLPPLLVSHHDNNNNHANDNKTCPQQQHLVIYHGSDLTLLDMMDLSHGRADATGSAKIWRGARCLVDSLPCIYDKIGRPSISNNIVELGCGCGVAGLAWWKLLEHANRNNNSNSNSNIWFTDQSQECLEWTRRNAQANVDISTSSDQQAIHYVTQRWEDPLDASLPARNTHIVLAADVLYQLQSLQPLLTTVQALVHPTQGYFLWSHVPRAHVDVNDFDDKVVSYENRLEQVIIDTARRVGLKLMHKIVPETPAYRSVGACIYIFAIA